MSDELLGLLALIVVAGVVGTLVSLVWCVIRPRRRT